MLEALGRWEVHIPIARLEMERCTSARSFRGTVFLTSPVDASILTPNAAKWTLTDGTPVDAKFTASTQKAMLRSALVDFFTRRLDPASGLPPHLWLDVD